MKILRWCVRVIGLIDFFVAMALMFINPRYSVNKMPILLICLVFLFLAAALIAATFASDQTAACKRGVWWLVVNFLLVFYTALDRGLHVFIEPIWGIRLLSVIIVTTFLCLVEEDKSSTSSSPPLELQIWEEPNIRGDSGGSCYPPLHHNLWPIVPPTSSNCPDFGRAPSDVCSQGQLLIESDPFRRSSSSSTLPPSYVDAVFRPIRHGDHVHLTRLETPPPTYAEAKLHVGHSCKSVTH